MNNKDNAVPVTGIEEFRRVAFRSKTKRGKASDICGCRIFLLTLILASIFLLGYAGAVTIKVCESGCGNNTSIKYALDYSKPGDIIEVHGGIYKEKLYISKNVSFIGIPDEKGMPVIDGNATGGSVITISKDGVNITGFKVMNSGDCACGDSGIRINSNNNTIYGNNITGNEYGVNIKVNATGNRIFGNSFINNSVNARDKGKNQWYGEALAERDTLSTILRYLSLAGPQYMGNYYDDHNEEGEVCKAEKNICSLPYNISGTVNSTNKDPYPLASPVL